MLCCAPPPTLHCSCKEHESAKIDGVRFWTCSNKSGAFRIEERSDWFCQDDLVDEDAAIVDSNGRVYLWIGPYASDVLVKLARASVEVCQRLSACACVCLCVCVCVPFSSSL